MNKRIRIRTLWYVIPVIFLFNSCTGGMPSSTNPGEPQYQWHQPGATDEENVVQENMFVVGISWQGVTPYGKRMEKLLNKFAAESDYTIRFISMDGENNVEKQISQIENFIAHKVDLILLNPCSYYYLEPAVNAANDAGIPIITMITRIHEQDRCTSFVGSDHKESALVQAAMASEYLAHQGSIGILEGTVGIEAQLARTEGYKQVLEKNPQLKVIASQPAYWEQDEAYVIVENWIYNGLYPDVIMSQSDSMALGALEAVTEAGLNDRIKVFGIDGDSEAVQSIRSGGMEGTVFQDAYSQAKCLFQCFALIRNGETPEKEYLVPFISLNKNNINDEAIQSRLQY